MGAIRTFHISEDIDFAIGVARTLGGVLGFLASVVASPFFAVGLIAYGVAHLIFVGEPSRILRHHRWAYLSWSVVALCLAAVVGTATWGGIQAYIISQVAAKTQEQFWRLTDDQKASLGNALDNIPEDQRFPITIRVVVANAQALTISDDLLTVFHAHGWTIRGVQDALLRADLLGINFVVALDWPRTDKDAAPHASELAHIFSDAGMKYSVAYQPGFDNNSLELAIGSRPPYW